MPRSTCVEPPHTLTRAEPNPLAAWSDAGDNVVDMFQRKRLAATLVRAEQAVKSNAEVEILRSAA
jgi:hypothetical protein